jgi:hypothetical protein
MAREMDLDITARGHYRKKNQPKVTLISGPHVHKKSRDQYKIDRFGASPVSGGIGGNQASQDPKLDSGLQPTGIVEPAESTKSTKLTRSTESTQSTQLMESGGEREKFLEFKNRSYRPNLDQGFSPTFTYPNRETLVL